MNNLWDLPDFGILGKDPNTCTCMNFKFITHTWTHCYMFQNMCRSYPTLPILPYPGVQPGYTVQGTSFKGSAL